MNRDRILNGLYCASSSGKRGWTTEAEALKCLGFAQGYRREDPNRGRVRGAMEEDVYECKAAGCNLYHLRSSANSTRRGEQSDKRRRNRI